LKEARLSDPVAPAAIPQDARPRLMRGVRLTHSEPHGGMVLLAPERVFKADAIATAILERCTGEATLAEIVEALAATYKAPPERILIDVTALLRGLSEKRLLEF
jgi:pyrroloquinoline quinone biosynthesis protein D